MGTTLEGKQINLTYQGLLKTTDNEELGATSKEITDGKGNGTGVSLDNSGNLSVNNNVTANAFIGDGSQLTNIPYPVTSVNTQTGDVVLDTDSINEGTTNLYYSDARVSANTDVVSNTAKISFDSISSAKLSGIENNAQVNVQSDWNETDVNSDAYINNKPNIPSLPVESVNGETGVVVLNTDDIAQGVVNEYYTDAKVSANADVVANTAKVGITTEQANAIVANSSKVGITEQQAADILTNNAKVGITAEQSDAIIVNSAKVGITPEQASEISANTLKVGITAQQAADILTNNSKVGITEQQASDILTNNAKVGITAQQAADIITNNSKVGITTEQADAITANTAKVGITTAQADAIIANTEKNSYPSADATKLAGIEAGADVTDATNVATAGALMSGTAVLSDLNDVASTTPTDGQVLTYDTTNGWQPETPTAGGAVDSVNGQTGTVSLGLLDLDDVGTDGTSGQVLTTNGAGSFTFTTVSGGGGAVDSVNGEIGTVVLDTDDISEGATNLYYTEARVSANTDVAANTAKVGITTQQAADIVTNNAKISFDSASSTKLAGIEDGAQVNPTTTDGLTEGTTNLYYTDARVSANTDVAANTAKVGITTQQAADIVTNNAKVSFDSTSSTKLAGIEDGAQVNVQSDWNATTGDALILNKPTLFDGAFSSLTGTPTTIAGYGITDALQLGTTSTTALAGDTTTITAQQASDILTNNAKVGITAQQASDITANNAKISFDSASSTKLAGIEANAQVNPTASEIKTSYESNADTNAFTDAEKTKLTGIASGAEVNVNADWNATTGDAQILNKPTLATVATTGAYSDLSGTPTLAAVATSGSYTDLTNKPLIPTDNSQLTNGAGYITDGNTGWDNTYGFITASSTDTLTNKSGSNSQWTNDAGYINVAAQTIHTNAIGKAIDFSARVTLDNGVAEGTSGIIKNLQNIM